jgi:serine/threonine-protein kinase RsbW
MADPRPERHEIITLSIPSRLELLNLVDQVTSSLSERLRFGEEERAAISLAVVEAGTNAIQHGHRHDGVTPVDLRYELFPDRITVTVHDSGPGFRPPAEIPDMTAPEHLLDERGRGIFIMRACMDRVDFDFTRGGTTVHLMKLAPAAPNGNDPAES